MSDKALVIDVVDNGGQWTHREWRMLRYLKVDTQIIPNTTPVEELRELDGLILSGGAARIAMARAAARRSVGVQSGSGSAELSRDGPARVSGAHGRAAPDRISGHI